MTAARQQADDDEDDALAAWAQRVAADAPPIPEQARARVRAALLDSLPDPAPAAHRRRGAA